MANKTIVKILEDGAKTLRDEEREKRLNNNGIDYWKYICLIEDFLIVVKDGPYDDEFYEFAFQGMKKVCMTEVGTDLSEIEKKINQVEMQKSDDNSEESKKAVIEVWQKKAAMMYFASLFDSIFTTNRLIAASKSVLAGVDDVDIDKCMPKTKEEIEFGCSKKAAQALEKLMGEMEVFDEFLGRK